MPTSPLGSGLTLVMIGAKVGATMENENVLGPSLPAELVAVTVNDGVAAVVGVPDSKPLDERVAQDGRPAPLVHVIGLVPVAVN